MAPEPDPPADPPPTDPGPAPAEPSATSISGAAGERQWERRFVSPEVSQLLARLHEGWNPRRFSPGLLAEAAWGEHDLSSQIVGAEILGTSIQLEFEDTNAPRAFALTHEGRKSGGEIETHTLTGRFAGGAVLKGELAYVSQFGGRTSFGPSSWSKALFKIKSSIWQAVMDGPKPLAWLAAIDLGTSNLGFGNLSLETQRRSSKGHLYFPGLNQSFLINVKDRPAWWLVMEAQPGLDRAALLDDLLAMEFALGRRLGPTTLYAVDCDLETVGTWAPGIADPNPGHGRFPPTPTGPPSCTLLFHLLSTAFRGENAEAMRVCVDSNCCGCS